MESNRIFRVDKQPNKQRCSGSASLWFFEAQSNLKEDGTFHGNLDNRSVLFMDFLPKSGSNKRHNKGVWWASSSSKEDGHCRRL